MYARDDKEKRNPIVTRELVESVKSVIRDEGGVDWWWSNTQDKRLHTASSDSAPQSLQEHVKSTDIFDIWFDSGSSFHGVLSSSAGVADVYCEGVDQFSGWFQSSLLLSVALNRTSPYKSLLVHGFVVDEHNRKMSKSLGNVIEPEQAIRGGANRMPHALRFWIAHEYYKPHIQIGPQQMDKFVKRVFELRSVLRYMVGNLKHGWCPGHLLAYDQLRPLDKYVLNELAHFTDTVRRHYDDMQLNKALLAIEAFFLTQLSGFYLKLVKDRLYCAERESSERRSAETAIYHILSKCLPLMAPIMPHLAEEAFQYSALKQAHSTGNDDDDDDTLFRSSLGLDDTSNDEWRTRRDKNVDTQFAVVNKLRQRFHELVQSDNHATYAIQLECDDALYSLLTGASEMANDRDNEWMLECFACSSLHLVRRQSEADGEKLERLAIDQLGDVGSFRLRATRVTDKRACDRCRRYNCNLNEHVCERCDKIVSK